MLKTIGCLVVAWMSGRPTPAKAAKPIDTGALFPGSPAEKGAAETFSCLRAISGGAADGVQSIALMQASAARQLDAAAYALTRISAELEGLMVLPVPEKTATVHRLEPLVRRERNEVWRKVMASQAA